MTRAPNAARRAFAAGAICLSILGGMIVGHAWPLWTGTVVRLKATPVDPRDLFRGEYVRLDTPATNLRIADGAKADGEVEVIGRWWDSPAEVLSSARGAVVFVQLAEGPDGLSTPVTVSRQRVAGALNLKARVRSVSSSHDLRIDYGLDAFYMQEGTARPVEEALLHGRNVLMEVAIASSGRARIRNLLVDGTPVR